MRDTNARISPQAHKVYAIVPLFIGTIAWCLLLPSSSFAQNSPITSSGLNTQVSAPTTLPSGKVQYDITGGTRPGGGTNLFHSFGDFGVPANNIANFLNETALPTSNILGRITGGNISNIFGTIQTTGFGNANLFLMNPAGFLFGPNATVNVGGMVAFTSADYLRLADGVRFNAIPNPTADILLSAAPVAAFGFLGSNPGAITVQGSQLSVADGTGISLVGGNITIQSGTLDNGTVQPAQLSAPNGNILLASAASPGEFAAATLQPLPNVDGASFTSVGSVTLAPGSSVDVSGTNTVSIRGGQFVLTVNDALLTTATNPGAQDTLALSRGSTIVTAAAGDEAGADVQIVGKSIQMDGASITSLSTGAGRGGAISVAAEDTISLTGGAQLVSKTEGAGQGGNISVEATSSTGSVTISGFDLDGTVNGVVTPFLFNPLTGNPLVASGIYSLTSGSKPGGNISITATTVSLQEGAVVATVTSGDARGGNIAISGDAVQITGGAELRSLAGQDFTAPDFEIRGTGRGGDILVSATDSVTVSGGSLDLFALSDIFTATLNPNVDPVLGQGQGGSITVSAPNIILDNAGTIVSTTQGRGIGGDINIAASNHLSVSGFSQDFGIGSAIITSASGTPSGNGGAIQVSAPSVTIEDGGRIATDNSSIGNGGNITLTVGDLTLRNGGSITSSGSGDGSSGRIQITATGTLSISGQFFDPNNPGSGGWSVIRNTTDGGSGLNGGIDIHAGKLVMKDGPQNAPNQDVGQIESDTGSSAGGTIRIIADDSISMSSGANIINRKGSFESGSIYLEAPSISLDKSAIRGRTNINRDAGAITLMATNGDLTLSNDSHILTSTQQGAGTGGPIVLHAAGSVNLSGGSTVESSSFAPATGDGGAVTLIAGNQVSLSGQGTALLTTTSGSGKGGTITVQAQQVQITDGAIISAKSTGSGAAGSVTIEGPQSPAQSILIDGAGSGVFTTTSRTGAGGNIFLNANTLTLQNGGKVSAATSGTKTTATGGTVTVEGNTVHLNSGATITTATSGPGNAGDILVKADTFSMHGGATITAASTGSGNAGNITIQGLASPAQSVLIDGAGSGIFTDTQGTGAGGNITLNANTVTLQNGGTLSAKTSGPAETSAGGTIAVTATDTMAITSGASISASSSGLGDAGSITVTAANGFTMQNSTITTLAGQGASGGNIKVTTSPAATVWLQNSTISASVADGPGGGGNISIDPQFVILQNSQILARAAQGQGGAITITAGLFLPDANSIVNADSGSGLNGSVTIQSPNAPASGKITPLSQKPLQATSLLNQRCAALAGGEFSSFTVAGRDSLPAEPGSWLASPLALLSAGTGLEARDEGERPVARGEGLESMTLEASPADETALLSLRQIAPAGFLTQAFAVDWSAGCQS